MPLRLLKRSHDKYHVVSKSTFLISVELLDNAVMECTLDTDSTGADCLLNISQRLSLQQPELFGLRYISRGVPPRQRWADLDRPLKKQLDKYAQDSQLSLGVMFYVADVNVLKDEMTRYHYFLQLKSDVIDGKLNCSIDQAISLAAYSLQAEFGDYDPERHTVEYLRDFAILPKELTAPSKYQDINIDALYEVITKQYGSLVGFPPPLAEIYYIMVTQSLDGYGQTAFPAKDDAGNDILFCVSAIGLAIRRRDWTHIAAFRFGDIKSLSGNKKVLIVQGTQSQRSIQFHFTDPEVVKYVKKVCLLQHEFYKDCLKEEQAHAAAAAAGESTNSNSRGNSVSIISGGSSSGTDHMDGHSFTSANFRGMTPDIMFQPSSSAIYENQFSLHNNNNVYNHSGNNSAAGSSSNIISNLGLNPQMLQQQLSFRAQMNGMHPGPFLTNQQLHPGQRGSLKELNNLQLLGNEYRPSMSRSSTPFNVYGPGNMLPQSVGHSFNLNNNLELQSLLPSYRPAPDYQTAVQLKYGQGAASVSDAQNSMTSKVSSANNSHQYLYGKAAAEKEEEEEPIYENEIVSQIHSMDLRESTEKEKSTPRGSLEVIVPSLVPHQAPQQLYTFLSEEQSSYLYKPPPPYPGTGIRSPNYEPHTIIQDGTYTKLRPTLNNHSEVLRQIGVQLRESSLSIQDTSTASSSALVAASQSKPTIETSKTSDSVTSSSLSVNSANSQNNGNGAPKPTEKETPSKSSKLKASYQKVGEHGSSSALSSANTSSNSSLGVNGIYSQQSSTSLAAAKGQMRRGSDISKNHSKSKLSTGYIYATSIDPIILKEYAAIPKAKSAPNFSTALKIENSKRNRCPNILPYEDNSVRLTPSRQNQEGYINASPVSAVVSGREWKYIVGQVPLAGNSASIWQMIWEMDVKVIAALERDSTALFYPLDCATSLAASALNTMYFGDFQIVDSKSEKDKASATSIARELTLIYVLKKQQRKVWVLPYEEEWKDDVPIHTEHFLCFLEEVNSVQRKVGDPSKPLVALCGTGAGRCGILILADILLHAADSGHKLRCDTLLAELRMQRMMLVSTPAQYAFVLRTLEKYLAQSRLI